MLAGDKEYFHKWGITMDNDKLAETKKIKGEGIRVGCLTGLMVAFILIVIGVMVSLTIIGLIIGIPLILSGIAYPFIARSLIKGQCPYCGSEVSALDFKPGVTCRACKKLIVIKNKKFFSVE